MSLFATLKAKREERKATLDQAGAILTKAHTAKRALTAEEDQEFERRHADGDRLLKEIEQLERQLQSDASHEVIPPDTRTAGREDISNATADPRTPDQKKADEKRWLRSWMLSGRASTDTGELRTLQARNAEMPPEVRALTSTTGDSGAYTVPVGYPYALDIALKYYGGILEAADYIDTDNGITLPYPTMNDTSNSGEQLAQNSASTEAQDQTFGIVNLGAYMLSSGIVLVPIALLQDSAFDPETWMNETLRIRLGRKVNNLCTVGTGSSTITGLLYATTLGVTAAAQAAVTYNELIDLEHSVDPSYRVGASWMFNDSTLKALKKLVDGNGRPLWIAGGASGDTSTKRPDTIDGFPYHINQDFPSLATGNKTITFGLHSKYKIRRVRQIQFVRFAERYLNQLQIGFMAFQRFDGNLIDAGMHPVKHLIQA